MRKRIIKALLVCGVAASVTMGSQSPVSATAVGGSAGGVTGAVTVPAGVDLVCKPTTYTFTPITLVGVFGAVADAPTGNLSVNPPGLNAPAGFGAYIGEFTTGAVAGGSVGCEDLFSANGTVGPFGFAGSTTVGPFTETINGNSAGQGAFVRVGPVVVVTLPCVSASINNQVVVGPVSIGHGVNALVCIPVVIVALFIPTPGQNGLAGSTPPIPGANSITSATFAGVYAGGGVNP